MEIKDLRELVEDKKFAQIQREFVELQEADMAELLNDTTPKEALLLFRLLPKAIAAEVFVYLDIDKQAEITELISEDELKEIIDELYFDDKIDLIEEVPANLVKKILRNTSITERTLINQFLNYPDQSAGSLMTIEFVDLKKEMTVEAAIARIRKIGVDKETIYTCYVTDMKRNLEGIVTLKELVLSDPHVIVGDIMTSEVISFNTHDDQEEIVGEFKKYDFLTMPVVDKENRLVGIITIDDIVDVIEEETTEDFQKMAAMTPSDEDYLSINAFTFAKRRISWLIILMFTAIMTEFITDSNRVLTTQFAMLVGVIPMLMSTSGNTGAQSSTLIIRGITLGDIRFKDMMKVIFKEVRVGFMVGLTLAVLTFLRITFLNKDIKLAVIVAFTLIATATIAAFIGGTLPIIAKKAKMDPAIMASPLISTITDATTLLIFFTIATLVLR